MTTFPPNQPDGDFASPIEQMPVEEPRRAASMTLRGDDVRQSRAASMEAANQSLADALRITYRLLQVVMVALAGLFFLSGFQQVNEGETGIRVTLGKVSDSSLAPGFRFSLPYPLGEVLKVQTGQRRLELDTSFWFFVPPENRGKPLSQLGLGNSSLRPGQDHALLTGDGNIAHARLSVVYRRENPVDFAANLSEGAEESIVRSAVERATVQVVSMLTIDDLMKRSTDSEVGGAGVAPGRESGMESRIRTLSQATLDTVKSGLSIDQIVVNDATPPLRVRADFARVQTAVTAAETARQRAEQERTRILNGAAGSAHRPLLDLIDDYEKQLELAQRDEADRTLGLIMDVLDGTLDGANATIAEREYPDVRISGEAAKLISSAGEYRSTVVTRAQALSRTFKAKREQYLANPSVFVSSEWVDAYREMLKKDSVEVFWAPPDTQLLSLRLTSDPKRAREMETAIKRREAEENWRIRAAMQAGSAGSSTTQPEQ